jgi:hypothetical protein
MMVLLEAAKYTVKIMQTGTLGDLSTKVIEPTFVVR